jgi:hypothetical protein
MIAITLQLYRKVKLTRAIRKTGQLSTNEDSESHLITIVNRYAHGAQRRSAQKDASIARTSIYIVSPVQSVRKGTHMNNVHLENTPARLRLDELYTLSTLYFSGYIACLLASYDAHTTSIHESSLVSCTLSSPSVPASCASTCMSSIHMASSVQAAAAPKFTQPCRTLRIAAYVGAEFRLRNYACACTMSLSSAYGDIGVADTELKQRSHLCG